MQQGWFQSFQLFEKKPDFKIPNFNLLGANTF